MSQQLHPGPRRPLQQGLSHLHPAQLSPERMPPQSQRPLLGPALPASPRKPLQSQQRTRKRISHCSPPSLLLVTDHTHLPGPSLTLPVALFLDRSGRGGRRPQGQGPVCEMGPGRPGLAVCMWRHRPSSCLSVCFCVFADISPCQPSTIGNHDEANMAPRVGQAGKGPGLLYGMPVVLHHLVLIP